MAWMNSIKPSRLLSPFKEAHVDAPEAWLKTKEALGSCATSGFGARGASKMHKHDKVFIKY